MKTHMILIFLFISMIGFGQTIENEDSTATPWDIRCYPNPTSDLLVIKSSIDIKEVTLFDLNGSVIKAPALPNWSYSLHDIPAGWVFVYIESVDGRIEKKNVFKQ